MDTKGQREAALVEQGKMAVAEKERGENEREEWSGCRARHQCTTPQLR